MARPLIKVATRSFSRHSVLRRELLAEFPEAGFNDDGRAFDAEGLIEYLDGADGAVVGLEPITDEVLGRLPGLKMVSKFGVGLDNVDQDALARHDVALGWTGGLNKRGVAEMTLCFLIGLARDIFVAARQLQSGDWRKSGGHHLSGRTVGIIGMGEVGKDLARLLKPFGCQILVNDIIDQGDYYRENDLTEASKDEIFAAADFVTIHTPLTDDTRHLIDARVLAKMKSSAFLINAARGAIVDQGALKGALMSGEIAGAAIDVFEAEPCEDLEFLRLPNLYCTPHTGGSAEESVLAMGRGAIGHLCDFFKDKSPP